MNSKHTPGPWIVDDRHVHCVNGFVYRDERLMTDGDDLVCEVNTDCRDDGLLTETDKANLALIAAAPDMFDACHAHEVDSAHDRLSELLEDEDADSETIHDAAVELCAALVVHEDKRKTAIAQAKGQPCQPTQS